MVYHRGTVSRALRLRMLAASGTSLPVDAELRYTAADPFAVEALFDTGTGNPVRWVFARDLLATGLVGRTGDGDVAVEPAVDDDGVQVVCVRLSSPDGVAVLEAAADTVSAFLASTFAMVPLGFEGRYLRVDEAVEALLSR